MVLGGMNETVREDGAYEEGDGRASTGSLDPKELQRASRELGPFSDSRAGTGRWLLTRGARTRGAQTRGVGGSGQHIPRPPAPHVLGPKVRARDPGICVSTSSLGHLRVTEAGEALEREMGGSGKVAFTPSCRTRHRSPRPAGRPGPARGCLFPPLFSASPLMLVCIRLFLTEQMGRLRCFFI